MNIPSPILKTERFPILLVVIVIAALILGALTLFIFLRPQVAPSIDLLDRFLPREEAMIRQVETVDLDVEKVTGHPVFQNLRQSAPLPLRVPPTGKTNLFF